MGSPENIGGFVYWRPAGGGGKMGYSTPSGELQGVLKKNWHPKVSTPCGKLCIRPGEDLV